MSEEVVALHVASNYAGTRLDRFVALSVADMSRSYARQLISEGYIRVNQREVKPSQLVEAGDQVTVWRPLPQTTDIQPEHIPLQIVYEDADIVVVNKASGMVVHPAPGHASGTLVNALLYRYPDLRLGNDVRPGIVHRLDQGTSGLIVAARNDQAMHALTEQQKSRAMHKVYLAVVEGRFKEPEGVINAPIGRHPTDRKRQAVTASGREARTHYRVMEDLGAYTLIEARLETGRTHQIRVHCAYIQHPVLGDPLYAPRKPRASFGLERQFLHAYKLGFVLPSDAMWREFTAPLPDDLADVLEKLRVIARTRR